MSLLPSTLLLMWQCYPVTAQKSGVGCQTHCRYAHGHYVAFIQVLKLLQSIYNMLNPESKFLTLNVSDNFDFHRGSQNPTSLD